METTMSHFGHWGFVVVWPFFTFDKNKRRNGMETSVTIAVLFVLAVAVGISIARRNKK